MKSIFLLIFLLLSGISLYAQWGGGPVCGIYYSYNANGERIQKKYDCVEPGTEGPAEIGSFHPVLYPNPTQGPIVVDYNELVSFATVSIYTIDGMHVAFLESGEGYSFHYDFADQVPGSYILVLTVIREGGEEAHKEFIVIKTE